MSTWWQDLIRLMLVGLPAWRKPEMQILTMTKGSWSQLAPSCPSKSATQANRIFPVFRKARVWHKLMFFMSAFISCSILSVASLGILLRQKWRGILVVICIDQPRPRFWDHQFLQFMWKLWYDFYHFGIICEDWRLSSFPNCVCWKRYW